MFVCTLIMFKWIIISYIFNAEFGNLSRFQNKNDEEDSVYQEWWIQIRVRVKVLEKPRNEGLNGQLGGWVRYLGVSGL